MMYFYENSNVYAKTEYTDNKGRTVRLVAYIDNEKPNSMMFIKETISSMKKIYFNSADFLSAFTVNIFSGMNTNKAKEMAYKQSTVETKSEELTSENHVLLCDIEKMMDEAILNNDKVKFEFYANCLPYFFVNLDHLINIGRFKSSVKKLMED